MCQTILKIYVHIFIDQHIYLIKILRLLIGANMLYIRTEEIYDT